MRALITLLKISLTIMTVFTLFILLAIIDGTRGGLEDYLWFFVYLLIGVICGAVLLIKRVSLTNKGFVWLACLHLLLFLLPSIGLVALLFWLIGQC